MAAKLLGSLVGAPVAGLGNAGFGAISNLFRNSRDQVLWRDSLTLQGALIGDQISLGLLRSTAFIDQGNTIIWPANFGAGCTLQVGDLTHPAALGTVNIAVATPTARTPLMPGWVPAWMGMPLWQRLGWASDPGGTIELLGTFAGGNPASLPMAWQICGRNT